MPFFLLSKREAQALLDEYVTDDPRFNIRNQLYEHTGPQEDLFVIRHAYNRSKHQLFLDLNRS
jgi:hypothetical protein